MRTNLPLRELNKQRACPFHGHNRQSGLHANRRPSDKIPKRREELKKLLMVCAALTLSACATVPDSVKVALEKEGAAISAVESDYKTSVNMYHAELIRQIDARLNDIFRHELEQREASGKNLTAAEVMQLEETRANQRELLANQAEKTKQKYLNNANLEILKDIHAKILQYAESNKFTPSDFATLLTNIDAGIDKIKNKKEKYNTTNPTE